LPETRIGKDPQLGDAALMATTDRLMDWKEPRPLAPDGTDEAGWPDGLFFERLDGFSRVDIEGWTLGRARAASAADA
jgi:hypothetical protein